MTQRTRIRPLSAALVAAGVIAGTVTSAGAFDLPWAKKNTPVAAATTSPAPVPLTQATVPDFRAIVQQSSPAVVGITVSGVHEASVQMQGLPPGFEDGPFSQFFRGLPGFPGGPRGNAEQPFQGMGSGFIVSADGLILTNAHVVREAKEVTVKLSDRREFAAKVLGADPVTDVAVLKVDAKNLPTVQLGDPSKLYVGDPVLAIGAPYGLEQTATQGIVSAKGRSLPGDSAVPFIQTDAAVNPGNSGGPLFDGQGRVVGINAQIYSRSGGYQGLSFAIPIDVAMNVKQQIVEHGRVQHARLGVTVQDVNQALADSFGLERPRGALVAQVVPGSAAAGAGLKSGDVILSVNGQAIERSGELSSAIAASRPGAKAELEVWRNRGEHTLSATLQAADTTKTAAASSDAVDKGQLGLALRPLSPEERRAAGVDGGLVVQNAAGPSARAGIAPGDVLLAINGRSVDSVDQIKQVLDKEPKSVALLVQRGDEKIFVPVKLG